MSAPDNSNQGVFTLALEDDESRRLTRVHADRNRWAAIVYLTLPEHCRGGTSWYRHRATGATRETESWAAALFGHLVGRSDAEIRDHVLLMSRDLGQWEEIQRIGIAYNRCVIFLSEEFHAVTDTFSTDRFNGRLTQAFEFYSI